MITLALVENGCKVFITSRDISKLEDVMKRYSGDGNERGEIIP
jgi:short-subunit dehydrogenase